MQSHVYAESMPCTCQRKSGNRDSFSTWKGAIVQPGISKSVFPAGMERIAVLLAEIPGFSRSPQATACGSCFLQTTFCSVCYAQLLHAVTSSPAVVPAEPSRRRFATDRHGVCHRVLARSKIEADCLEAFAYAYPRFPDSVLHVSIGVGAWEQA